MRSDVSRESFWLKVWLLRIVGFALLLGIFDYVKADGKQQYFLLFCAGCGLFQLAAGDVFRMANASPAHRPLIVGTLFFDFLMFFFALASVTALVSEIWIGTHLYSFWAALKLILLSLIPTAFLAAKMHWITSAILGLLLAVVALSLLF
jgi:hypothetical protein